jgi:hypothetical protein
MLSGILHVKFCEKHVVLMKTRWGLSCYAYQRVTRRTASRPSSATSALHVSCYMLRATFVTCPVCTRLQIPDCRKLVPRIFQTSRRHRGM